ncbi:MAG: hypothetical protein ACFHWX_10710 [Bacteroidota bacterium]
MEPKQRHGCVTAWLILLIIGGAFSAATYFFMNEYLAKNYPVEIPETLKLIYGVISIVNIFLAFMLLRWKRWAFYFLAMNSILVIVLNLYIGLSIGFSISGLIGLAILFGILQIKKGGKSAWENLE